MSGNVAGYWRHFGRLQRLQRMQRMQSTLPVKTEHVRDTEKMSSWQIHSYGDLEELTLSTNVRIPHITAPNQVLVKVNAASVNPIDVAMIGGYGATALNLMRTMDNVEFPLTLGRDFCGQVVSKGHGVKNNLSIGSHVWGVVPVHRQGCHAEYVIVDDNQVGEKPSSLNTEEASSILYTGLTAWSGLMFSANLKMKSMSGLKALVLGASGGVGNAAVQILNAGGANVTATCATDAVKQVETIGANNVVDYSAPDFQKLISDFGRFDLVLDCAGLGTDYASNEFIEFRNYVTFTTPLLKNFDNQGLIRGSISTLTNLMCPNIKSLKKGGIITWAYFVPSMEGINYLHTLVESKKLKPNVEEIYSFDNLLSAYQRVKAGHLRGKIVVNGIKE